MSYTPDTQWVISGEQAKEISWRLSGYKVQAKIDEILESLPEVSSELRTQAAKIEALEKDAKRLDWIIDNASIKGGGNGFTLSVFVPIDCECVKTAIDAAIAGEAT